MTVDAGPDIVTSGLVLSLDAANTKSYPGSGTTWTDLSGNGRNGTLTNGPTYSSSNNGTLVFDGTDDYVLLPTTSDLTFSGDFTFECWILRTGTASSNHIWALPTGQTLQINDVGSLIYYDTGQRALGAINANTWYNATISRISTTITGYYNGLSIFSVTNSASHNFSGTAIGYRKDLSPFGLYWLGNISNVKLYNRALTQQQVSQNFNALRGRYGI